MKIAVPFKQNLVKLTLLLCVIASGVPMKAQDSQTVPELIFKNPVPESGTAGSNGAVYRFPDVANNIDALVTIAGRSSTSVQVVSMDLNNTGYDNAFQPQIGYMNGNAPANSNWWIDFDFNFVVKNTTTPVTVTMFNLSGLDIDGDGGNLYEYVDFMSPQSYILENNTLITTQSIVDWVLGVLTPGRKFSGPTTNFNNINVTATEVMTTLTYLNKSFFRMRAGGATINGSSSAANRMYSFWFKGFTYNTPAIFTLPVKLESFTAMLVNKKADLKWVTSSEINVSHFAVEKSTDGKNFSDAGVVFAYGSTSAKTNYTFSDNLANEQSSVVYYRLRSVDIDGKTQFSDTRVIRLAKQTGGALSILTYPNPVVNELRITVPETWQNKKLSIELVNASGTTVNRVQTGNASQTETVRMSSLAPGFYIVRVSCNGEMAQQKIIKQ